jgi:hypothetical protein
MRANRSGIRIVHRLTTLLAAPVIAGACASTGPAASTVTDSTEAASPSPTQRGPWPSTTRGRPARCQGISHDDDPDHHRRTAGGRPARRQSDCPRPHGSTSDDLDLPRLNQVEKIAKLPRPLTRKARPKATTPRSRTSATTRRHRTSSSTTATSATGTESYGSANSTATKSISLNVSPTASRSPSKPPDRRPELRWAEMFAKQSAID